MVLDVIDVLLFQCTFPISVANVDFILLLLCHIIIVSHFDSFVFRLVGFSKNFFLSIFFFRWFAQWQVVEKFAFQNSNDTQIARALCYLCHNCKSLIEICIVGYTQLKTFAFNRLRFSSLVFIRSPQVILAVDWRIDFDYCLYCIHIRYVYFIYRSHSYTLSLSFSPYARTNINLI